MLLPALCLLLASPLNWQTSPERQSELESFELIWSTLRDHYWDAAMGGRNWEAIHKSYKFRLDKAKSREEADAILLTLLRELPSSHLAIIPSSLYHTYTQPATGSDIEQDESGEVGIDIVSIGGVFAVQRLEPDGSAARSGVQLGWTIQSVNQISIEEILRHAPNSRRDRNAFVKDVLDQLVHGPQGSTVSIVFRNLSGQNVPLDLKRQQLAGEIVQFGNLPPERVIIEHRILSSDVGYIRLNVFLAPVLVMPEIERAIKEFRTTRGVILDLRENPGGLGIMAMGIAGWFVSQRGQRLGTMHSRDSTEQFEINPRLNGYTGGLAILVDEDSASTSEILAQGLQDLGRARVFGVRTAGAALPSVIIQLPNGDRFQYPEANYASWKGRILEGNGVQPDTVVAPTLTALSQGRDLVIEAAIAWLSKTESGKPEVR